METLEEDRLRASAIDLTEQSEARDSTERRKAPCGETYQSRIGPCSCLTFSLIFFRPH